MALLSVKEKKDRMKTMSGYCASCGVEIIVREKKGKARFLDIYRNHILKLSNGTIMRVGICSDCKVLLTSGNKVQETADDIIDNHKHYWKNHKKYAPKGYEDITVEDPNTNISKFRREQLLDRHKQEVGKQDKDKLRNKNK